MDWKRVGVVVGVAVAGMMFAETVTVNPPAGTVTNAVAFVSGEDSLAVNTGAQPQQLAHGRHHARLGHARGDAAGPSRGGDWRAGRGAVHADGRHAPLRRPGGRRVDRRDHEPARRGHLRRRVADRQRPRHGGRRAAADGLLHQVRQGDAHLHPAVHPWRLHHIIQRHLRRLHGLLARPRAHEGLRRAS